MLIRVSSVVLFFMVLLSPISVSAQRNQITKEGTRIFDERIDKSYKGGEAEFAHHLARRLVYPASARTNGIMGLSVFAFKVDCENKPYSILFKTKLGFGIESEIERVIKLTKGNWRPCSERDTAGWLNFKISFTLNDLYQSSDSFFELSGRGDFPGVSDETLIKDLNKAMAENRSKDARAALTKLVMRFPYNQEYRTKLIELTKE